MKVFWALIIVISVFLFWTILFFEYSPWYYLSNLHNSFDILENNTTVSPNDMNTWAVRGQIGDILAGHFSALAFFAIALSIYFQSEGNKQIQKSIEKQEDSINQQKDALKIQSNALKAQIEELQESRKESKKQTEEFFMGNMNVKLDRFYKILDGHLKIVTEELLSEYFSSIASLKTKTNLKLFKSDLEIEQLENTTIKQSTDIRNIVITLDFIYGEIIKIGKTSPLGYQTYIEELRLRLHSNKVFYKIYRSFEDSYENEVFSLFREEQK